MATGIGSSDMPRLELTSLDPTEERREALRELCPEAFDENSQLDLARLRELLGDFADGKKDRYNLSWAGKSDAQRALQILSTGTLQPIREESQDFDTTQNAIIEGDNLEVLKLLQKAYHGKVKMIYIDPPYNTGNDFIYPDNFREGLQTYLEYTGQAQKKVRETEENLNRAGRIHSNWLNMMYPRLALARNLLREDGVIFVSIDDHEVHNLRMLMDEVFGEENFVGQIVVQSNPRGSQSVEHVANVHEYVLFYARNAFELADLGIELTDAMKAEYKYSAPDGRKCRLLGLRQRGGAWRRRQRPLLWFPIYVDPKSGQVSLEKTSQFSKETWPIQPSTGEEGTWRWNPRKVEKDGKDLVGKPISRAGEDESWDVFQYDYLERRDGEERKTKAKTIWAERELNYQNGTSEVKALFDGKETFAFPKPVFLFHRLLSMANCVDDDLILDFFAGSGTTAQAVMELNQEDGGNRRFILVQLPEPLDPPITLASSPAGAIQPGAGAAPTSPDAAPTSPGAAPTGVPAAPTSPGAAPTGVPAAPTSPGAAPTGPGAAPTGVPAAPTEAGAFLRTIADICRERVRRAAKKIAAKSEGKLDLEESKPDLGFRAFRLTGSNFKLWEDKSNGDPEKLAAQLKLYAENILPDREPEAILFEILHKSGIALSTTIQQIEVDSEPVFKIDGGRLLAYLKDPVDESALRKLVEMGAEKIVCLDHGFRGNDSLKANIAQQVKQHNAHHPDRPLDFRTV